MILSLPQRGRVPPQRQVREILCLLPHPSRLRRATFPRRGKEYNTTRDSAGPGGPALSRFHYPYSAVTVTLSSPAVRLMLRTAPRWVSTISAAMRSSISFWMVRRRFRAP